MGRFDVLLNTSKPIPIIKTPGEAHIRQPETPQTVLPENLKSGKPENLLSRKPEIVETGNHGNPKNEKYSTQLQPTLIKQIKQYALEHDVKDYEVIQQAVKEYLEKKK